MEEMKEQPLAEFDVDAVRRMRQRVTTQILQGHVEQADDDEPADEHQQRVVAAMRQHLVDDDLKEQRRHQREDLHEKRGDHHMRQRTAITPDRRQKPFEAEGLRVDPGAAEFARDENDGTRRFGETVERNGAIGARQWIDEPVIAGGQPAAIDFIGAGGHP